MVLSSNIFSNVVFSGQQQKQHTQIAYSILDYPIQSNLNQVSIFNPYPSNVPFLGGAKDEAKVIRDQLSSFSEGWDDPLMDIYNFL